MRKILFRGKRKDGKGWCFGNVQAPFPTKENPSYNLWHMNDENHIQREVNPETVGQFTGLTDKNGKEIFEGDILYTKFEDKNEEKGYYEVYNEVSFQFGAYGFIGEITGEFLPFSIYPIEKEIVIGNIHDNPELLTK